jgi:hypothetical protein
MGGGRWWRPDASKPLEIRVEVQTGWRSSVGFLWKDKPMNFKSGSTTVYFSDDPAFVWNDWLTTVALTGLGPDDWLVGQAFFDYTISTPGSHTITVADHCCRISGLVDGNNDTPFST